MFFSGLRDLWFWLRIARPPATPARTAPAANSGVFAFEAISATAPPALLATLLPTLLPLFAAPRPVDLARDCVLEVVERFRCVRLPFEVLPRRELEEALEDEPLRPDLLERLLDVFVAWAMFQPFSFASLRAPRFALAAIPL